MAPRINLLNQALAYRPRTASVPQFFRAQPSLCRSYASGNPSKDLPVAEKGEQGPNMQQQEHVSEEAAKMAKITGGEGPDLTQGTPVQDLLREDKEAQKHAPQVLKESLRKGDTTKPSQSRSFSTYARQQQLEQHNQPATSLDPPVFEVSEAAERETAAETETSVVTAGHKFPLPTLPLPSNAHKDYRYDPVVRQVTNLLMQDGRLSVAQRNMSLILQHLRTASPPTYNPARPLLPGAPPASHLPLNPTLYLTLALDSIAPLLRIRSQRGAAGGGVALQIPVPLGLRQRRRQAMTWILDAASKRKSRASGKGMFATRVAEEIVAVVEGRSSCWEKRTGVHKIATTARSNLTFGKGGRR
ncbi:ribosomal protein S7 domain-containing protein [Delphinella strobiligena]|nr:ribosomal protein S7 domain-containing protein [Delphinella strobiligena]